jgi:hypothetical protein
MVIANPLFFISKCKIVSQRNTKFIKILTVVSYKDTSKIL